MQLFTNDNHMYYDMNTHRYVLKPEYFRDTYSIELIEQIDTSGSINARQAVEGLLKRASSILYNYIYQHNQFQKDYLEYRLVKYGSQYREALKEAMGELVYYWLTNNADLTIQSGVNVEAGKIFTKRDIAQNTIPHSSENILMTAGVLSRAKWRVDNDPNYNEDKPDRGIDW